MKIINYRITLGIFFTLFWLTLSTSAELNIATSAEETTPVPIGSRAPNFTAYNVEGSVYDFNADKLERPTLLITFRGGWCPYCNAQLQELRNVLPKIKASGLDVLFLSGDRPEILYSNLQQEVQGVVEELDYTILSDADMNMGRAFGLAFRVHDDIISKYQSRDWDLDESSMEKQKALSVPAVYLIRKGGEITFAYANPDYRIRLPADEVKKAVDQLLEEESIIDTGSMNHMM